LELEHHPVFSHFQPFQGMVAAHYGADFLGTKIRHEFVAELYTRPETSLWQMGYPPVNEDYLEWIDLLESVVEARDLYTMVELGAGFGRWVVRAAFAVKQYNNRLPCRLVAVEAEPVTFRWMALHFEDNGVDASDHRLIHAASSDKSGEAPFYIGGPRGGAWDLPPNEWYGQCLAKDYDVKGEYRADGQYQGFPVRLHDSGWRSINIPAVTLKELMAGIELVDFLDMDIEGAELPVISSSIFEMNTKVKRVHIGTHSQEIEAALRAIFSRHGWCCVRDYSISTRSETPWGPVDFGNGVQSWVNPRLK
jgi:FkbM family methyltransferase